jgi:hypothetical protein
MEKKFPTLALSSLFSLLSECSHFGYSHPQVNENVTRKNAQAKAQALYIIFSTPYSLLPTPCFN